MKSRLRVGFFYAASLENSSSTCMLVSLYYYAYLCSGV